MDDQNSIKKLVKECQAGNSEAFGKIYDIFLGRIYRFVFFRTGKKEEAEDISEEIFIKAWGGLKKYQDRNLPFEAWLFRIARNHIIDYYRSLKKTVSITEALETEDKRLSLEESVELKLDTEMVIKKIKMLRDSYQEIITLKFIEDKDNKEISLILGKPVGQIRVLQNRAIQALRKVLEK